MMAARITLATVRWDGVPGATGYEIRKDGNYATTAGQKARTTRVSVDEATLIEVIDLPNRTLVQALDLTQVTQ